jgi:hypothetical protein
LSRFEESWDALDQAIIIAGSAVASYGLHIVET